ncbi:hypothetical protein MAP00_003495 [Monascus purpureus]|nr:hypothetical protein MAP00_003495 [Monascus purpureus]
MHIGRFTVGQRRSSDLLQFQVHIRASHFFFFIFDSYCSGSELPFYRFHKCFADLWVLGGKGEKTFSIKKIWKQEKVQKKEQGREKKSCHKYWPRLDTCLEN